MKMFVLEARKLAAAAVFFATATSALADGLAMPEGPVVLRVTGDISMTNDGDAAVFDISMLEALGTVEVTTNTIWTEGTQTFRGTSLKALTDALGVTEGTIKATAMNDYMVQIPADDAVDGGAVIAFERNGAEMSVRDKGPLWIIYPYDADPKYQAEVYYSRSIWQLDRMEMTR